MACIGGFPRRCDERCGGDRLCPLAFRLALRIAARSAATALDLRAWAPWAVCLAGLAALLGHSRSIWLNFAGGKSAATGLGVLLAVSWPIGLGTAAVFGGVLAVFRIVSLASMLAALAAIALVCGLEEPLPYRLLVIAGGIYVIVRHRANIQRLLAGAEPRVGRSSSKSEGDKVGDQAAST